MTIGRCVAVLAAAALLSCNAATEKRVRKNTQSLLGKVSDAGDKVAEGLTPAWEMTKNAGTSLVDSAKSLDAARNGCSLEERRDFEISASEEYYLGRSLAAEQIARLGSDNLAPDHPVSQYVDRVGQFLAVAAEVYGEQNKSDRWKDYPEKKVPNRPWPYGGYHFIVLNRAEPNAFGGPGGAVMVTTGLLAQLQSEDELAAVLAHEIVHVQRGHGVEFIKAFMCQSAAQDKAYAPARAAADGAKKVNDALPEGSMLRGFSEDLLSSMMDAVSDKAKALYKVGYPRGFELEADRIALRHMALAGYDPQAMPRLLERLEKVAEGEDDYGVTHPRFKTRLKVVKPVIAKLEREGLPKIEDVEIRTTRFMAAMQNLPALPPPAKEPVAAK